MIEVLIALLVAAIGLLGTLAVQQTLLNATANATDGSVALRLASQALEELQARVVAPGSPPIDRMQAAATGSWTTPVYLDVAGRQAAGPSAAARWQRRTRIVDLGTGQPYNISVEITYALDTGAPKTVQLDMERRK
jgi:Tfp pilus assembly protein PilV